MARGSLQLDTLEKNRRFTFQCVVLSDVLNRKHVGQIILDMRFVNKDEVATIMDTQKKSRADVSSL